MKLEHGTPMDIEWESMRIIREELSAMGVTLPPDRAAAVLRASPPGRWRRVWPP